MFRRHNRYVGNSGYWTLCEDAGLAGVSGGAGSLQQIYPRYKVRYTA